MASALRRVWARGYRAEDLRADLMAGSVVGVVALPLSMALAIAVGAPPQHGLYTAIVAGAVVAVLGGCKFQVTGPTAAFVVVLAPILAKHGLPGLLTAGLLSGVLLVALGLAGLGRLIVFIPYPVTTGFTAGIATVIATLQLKDALGLPADLQVEHYVDKVSALWAARRGVQLADLAVSSTTLALLLLLPRVIRRIPAPLLAIGISALGVVLAHRIWPGFEVATIGTRFHTVVDGVERAGIPATLPWPALPWGQQLPSLALVRELLPAAFAIAMLGAIESLLSAVIADGMTNTKHDPDAELVALGVGNIMAPFFGGIAATGALARTATNIRAGARSPLAAVTHAVVVLLAMVVFAPLVGYVPMASLAALLLLVAWNMSELPAVRHLLRVAPRSDVLVLVTCFLLTVVVDMVIAVSAGFLLAAVLFMRRMSEHTESRLRLDSSEELGAPPLPKGVLLYEINGPLFFGAAQKAIRVLDMVERSDFKVLVIHLGRVPVIDVTGFAALEGAFRPVLARQRQVVLAGPLPKPTRIFEKAALPSRYPGLHVCPDLSSALALAESLAAQAA